MAGRPTSERSIGAGDPGERPGVPLSRREGRASRRRTDDHAGESVALVGPNGAGKSTLLLHLNGLLPGKARGTAGHGHAGRLAGTATAGACRGPSVWIDGLEVNDRNAPEVRRRVGLVFQDPDDQLFCNTVIEDVAFGPLNLGKTAAEARRIALDCLDGSSCDGQAERPPHHLSFGERKRACLAGVLACEPSVLVLDEPSANLDPRGRRRFIQLIQSLTCTKLIATHDLEMVLELCPRTVLLDAGRVVADGPSRDILGDAELIEAHGLEQPLSLKYGTRGMDFQIHANQRRRQRIGFSTLRAVETGVSVQRPQVRIVDGFGHREAAHRTACVEQLHRVREQALVIGFFREDRDGTGGVVQAMAVGALDQAVDVVEGGALAEPARTKARSCTASIRLGSDSSAGSRCSRHLAGRSRVPRVPCRSGLGH